MSVGLLKRLAASFAAILVAFSCNTVEPEELNDNNFPEYITAIAPGLEPDSKTVFTADGLKLKSTWETGDHITVSPNGRSSWYKYYTAQNGGPEAVFKLTKSNGIAGSYNMVYYPGGYIGDGSSNKMYNDYTYTNFSYKGQMQCKSDPMAFLSLFHTLRMKVRNYEDCFDFSKARQSSCMRFILSGITFHKPTKIELELIRGGEAFEGIPANNQAPEMISDGNYIPLGPKNCSMISLDLDEYGDEKSLDAYLMMPDRDWELQKGDLLRVYVTCSDGIWHSDTQVKTDITLTGGRCHILVKRSGWTQSRSRDKEVVVLQKGNSNLQIVLVGDGYTRKDIDRGLYDNDMRRFYSYMFNIPPYSYLKKDFSVSYVIAESETRFDATNCTNGAINNPDAKTKFSVKFTANSTVIKGNDDMVLTYSNYAFTDYLSRYNRLTVVIANQECRSGTCYMTAYNRIGVDYGYGYSIAYLGKGRTVAEGEQLLHHEAMGHGFAKLGDEYGSASGGSSKSESMQEWRENYGHYRNIDIYNSDKSKCYWKALFGTANNYESNEGLGVYLGGFGYKDYFARPTSDGSKSIMNKNTGIFNAQCRRQIYYRYKGLSGKLSGKQWGSAQEIGDFLTWDRANFLTKSNVSTNSIEIPVSYEEFDPASHTPPVLRIGDPNDLILPPGQK